MMDHQRRIYIMGAPRSGTTLMAWLLRRHDDCFITYECCTVPALYRALTPPRNAEFGVYKFAWRHENSEGAPHVMWPLPHLEHYLDTAGTHATVEDVTPLVQAIDSAIYRKLFPNATWVGDKSPSYSNQWQHLRRVWPDCHIINMLRNIDDNADSIVRQAWDPDNHAAARKVVNNRRRQAALCPGVYNVQLEDLNESPRDTIGELLDWLGLQSSAYDWDRAIQQIVNPEKKVN